MNGYDLSRNWFNFCFENPEKVRPIHTAIYFFAIEHCNRLGWKQKFGFPSQMVMEAIGVKNWRTYSTALQEIVEFGFIKMIEISKNQYSSNIIAIAENTEATTEAPTKALDKALSKHSTKQSQSIVSIDKQETNNNITINNKQDIFNFKNSLIELGIEINIVETWLKIRKTKKAVNSEIAFNRIKNEIEKSGRAANDCIKYAVEKSWSGFEAEWINKQQQNFNNYGGSQANKSRAMETGVSGSGYETSPGFD